MFALMGYLYIKFFDSDSNDKKINADYLTGLKYLLNEESDKAIDLFSNIIEVDEDTIQTHLALGVLFRRQGKIDKAIKLHENIIKRSDLEENYYFQTLSELGENYFAAGIYDKAEEIFIKLKEINTHKISSLEKLIKIYEYLSQWDQALKNLEELSNVDRGNILINSTSHYYSQLSQDSIDNNDLDKAEEYLLKARDNNPKSIRHLYLSSLISLKKDQNNRALDFYVQMTAESPVGHFLLLPLILQSADKREIEIIENKLAQMISDNPEAEVYFSMLSVSKPDIKSNILAQSFRKQIFENAIIKVILNQNNNISQDLINDDLIKEIKSIIYKKTLNDYKYNCNQCGYETISHSWQCPTCKSWEKSTPINFIEKI
tara:strand:- start:79 stop:1200 length:1122 start_codon:yes stop_codon:yes gene_type:complete